MEKQSVINGLVWIGFTLALVVATAPVWQRAVYGFNPTLSDLLRVALCRTVVDPGDSPNLLADVVENFG